MKTYLISRLILLTLVVLCVAPLLLSLSLAERLEEGGFNYPNTVSHFNSYHFEHPLSSDYGFFEANALIFDQINTKLNSQWVCVKLFLCVFSEHDHVDHRTKLV